MVSPEKASARLGVGGGGGDCVGAVTIDGVPPPSIISSKSIRVAGTMIGEGETRSRPNKFPDVAVGVLPAAIGVAPELLQVATGTAPADPALRLFNAATAFGSEDNPPNRAAAIFSFSLIPLGARAAVD